MSSNILLSNALLHWYYKNNRCLPFRQDPTAYHIWVSEIMLQQTQMNTVLPYYTRFIQQLPTVEALAYCPDDLLHKLWEGLGYYSRVRNMKKAANIIMDNYGGTIPNQYKELLNLPGIGPYTAGAIASIAFNEPYVAVDGNVLRVFSRLLADARDMKEVKVKKEISLEVQKLQPINKAGDFNQAIMELGALVCTPTSPLCQECPLQINCKAYEQGIQSQLPIKPTKKAKLIDKMLVFIIHTPQGILLQQRPKKGLLAGLWQPFCISSTKIPTQKSAQAILQRIFPTAVLGNTLENSKHVFTHRIWHIYAWEATLNNTTYLPDGFIVANPSQIKNIYSIPSAFKAYMPFLLKE